MRDIDKMAVMAAKDEMVLRDFINSNKRFITNCAHKATRKFITGNDDEWSVALIAFSDAVKTYELEKGAFLSYAETAIKRKLIDYYRAEKKHSPEYPVNPSAFETEPDEDDEDLSVKIAVSEKLVQIHDNSIRYEIEAANAGLNKFGFSFYDLAECSPKSIKTKQACKQAVLYIMEDKAIFEEIARTKKLPIKKIQKNTGLPRKSLESHRKYIIAALEILSGDYPYLADYLSYIGKAGQ